MDLSVLVRSARSAGLSLTIEADRLRIRGPRRADAIARQVAGRREEVLAYLRSVEVGEGLLPTVTTPPPMEIVKPLTPRSIPRDVWDSFPWSPLSLDYEQRYGQRYARLFPYTSLKKSDGLRVQTPHGRGRMLIVAADRCHVHLESDTEGQITFFPPEEILPAEREREELITSGALPEALF